MPAGKLTKSLHLKDSQMAVAFRHLKPSWRHYIDYCETAAKNGDPDADKLLRAYYKLTRREQVNHMPEQLCDLAGVKPEELFGIVATELWRTARMEANLIVAAAYPKVIERTAKLAETKNGFKDRELFHKATGFLPQPKGPSINIDASHKQLTVAPTPSKLPSMEDDALAMEHATAIPLIESPHVSSPDHPRQD